MNAEIVITVEIDDGAALHSKAGSDYCVSNADRLDAFDEAIAMFGPEENPDLAACLRHLYDVSHGDAGVRAVECEARVDDGTAFRVGRTVNVSIEHITPAELKRINEAFGMEKCDTTYRAFEDIEHDGLYMSPKNHGFILRIPGSDFLDERMEALSPEMRGIVELAVAQGATRIEFDADEEPIDALPVFEH
jgi:hypothetical protein